MYACGVIIWNCMEMIMHYMLTCDFLHQVLKQKKEWICDHKFKSVDHLAANL